MLRRLLLAAGGGGSFIGAAMSEYAMVYSNVVQSVPHNANTTMTMTTVDYDPVGYWSVSHSSRLTVPTGKGAVPFIVMGGSFTNQDPAQDIIMFIQVNGSGGVRGSIRTFPQTGSNNNPAGYMATNPVPTILNDGDYIELIIYMDNAAGAANFGNNGTSSNTWLSLIRLA